MRVRHIVCLRFKKDVPTDARQEICARLRALPGQIPEIKRFEVNLDLGLDPARNHDAAITADFDGKEDYQVYATHPKHTDVLKDLKPMLDVERAGRVAVQFELGPCKGKGPHSGRGPPPVLPLWRRPYDIPLILLYCYFVFSCTCIESTYCADSGPMDPTDQRFMMPETFAYASENNPLFLARPEWLRVATCFSAYGLMPFYLAMLITFVVGLERARPLAFVLAGLKLYALGFYHYLEFTSATPPPNLVNYWLPEGPYLVALAVTLFRMRRKHPFGKGRPPKEHAD